MEHIKFFNKFDSHIDMRKEYLCKDMNGNKIYCLKRGETNDVILSFIHKNVVNKILNVPLCYN